MMAGAWQNWQPAAVLAIGTVGTFALLGSDLPSHPVRQFHRLALETPLVRVSNRTVIVPPEQVAKFDAIVMPPPQGTPPEEFLAELGRLVLRVQVEASRSTAPLEIGRANRGTERWIVPAVYTIGQRTPTGEVLAGKSVLLWVVDRRDGWRVNVFSTNRLVEMPSQSEAP